MIKKRIRYKDDSLEKYKNTLKIIGAKIINYKNYLKRKSLTKLEADAIEVQLLELIDIKNNIKNTYKLNSLSASLIEGQSLSKDLTDTYIKKITEIQPNKNLLPKA